jgi:hypothetical protein
VAGSGGRGRFVPAVLFGVGILVEWGLGLLSKGVEYATQVAAKVAGSLIWRLIRIVATVGLAALFSIPISYMVKYLLGLMEPLLPDPTSPVFETILDIMKVSAGVLPWVDLGRAIQLVITIKLLLVLVHLAVAGLKAGDKAVGS